MSKQRILANNLADQLKKVAEEVWKAKRVERCQASVIGTILTIIRDSSDIHHLVARRILHENEHLPDLLEKLYSETLGDLARSAFGNLKRSERRPVTEEDRQKVAKRLMQRRFYSSRSSEYTDLRRRVEKELGLTSHQVGAILMHLRKEERASPI